MIKNYYYVSKYKILNFYVVSNILKYFKNKILTIIKSKNILKFIKDKNDKRVFVFVYDLKISPFAYGEFLSNLIFLKYISLFKKIKLYLIKYEKQNDHHHQDLSTIKKKKRLIEFIKIAEFFLNKKSVDLVNFDEFKNIKNKSFFIWEEKKVYDRIPIYSYVLNTLHYIFDKKYYNKFIINNKHTYKIKLKKKLPRNFIILAIKYKSNFAAKFRSYSINEIHKSIKYLLNQYPKNNVLIVTDTESSKILKKNIKNRKNIYFSKDFGDNFLSDLRICLQSNLFFCLKPTGSTTLVEYSKVPYICYHLTNHDFSIFSKNTLPNDLYFKKKIRHPWQTKKQIWVIGEKNNVFNYRIVGKGLL